MSYDLRRLRLHGLIERIPRTNTYTLTPDGIRVAVFYTKVHDRLLRPLLDAPTNHPHPSSSDAPSPPSTTSSTTTSPTPASEPPPETCHKIQKPGDQEALAGANLRQQRGVVEQHGLAEAEINVEVADAASGYVHGVAGRSDVQPRPVMGARDATLDDQRVSGVEGPLGNEGEVVDALEHGAQEAGDRHPSPGGRCRADRRGSAASKTSSGA